MTSQKWAINSASSSSHYTTRDMGSFLWVSTCCIIHFEHIPTPCHLFNTIIALHVTQCIKYACILSYTLIKVISSKLCTYSKSIYKVNNTYTNHVSNTMLSHVSVIFLIMNIPGFFYCRYISNFKPILYIPHNSMCCYSIYEFS